MSVDESFIKFHKYQEGLQFIKNMGNSNQSQSFLKKGEGLRILAIKLNSPFDGKVQPFFDFIIDIIPQQPSRSPKEILDKLSGEQIKKSSKKKNFQQIINENEDKVIDFKIVSTKQRNVRTIQVTPNRNWNGSMDLIGVQLRKQKFDEAFDTYYPVVDIAPGSPIQLAGVREGQYLIGCMEFSYVSLNNFIQGLYDRYFDKEVLDKNVHLAFYNVGEDQLSIKPVLLKRGWGGKGLLGCEFMQGQLYKFPHNLKQKREKLQVQKKQKQRKQQLRKQLKQCDGVSKSLAEALKNKRNKKGKHIQTIKNMISVPLPEIPRPDLANQMTRENLDQGQLVDESQVKKVIMAQGVRIEFLERRVSHLQETLSSIRQYLDTISQEEHNQLGYQEQKTPQKRQVVVKKQAKN